MTSSCMIAGAQGLGPDDLGHGGGGEVMGPGGHLKVIVDAWLQRLDDDSLPIVLVLH